MKLKFPQFICLVGPRSRCHLVFDELMKRHDIPHMDFSDPVIEATLTTFYNSLQIDVEDQWHKTLPNTTIAFNEWIERQTEFMKATLGRDILGKIFLKYYM